MNSVSMCSLSWRFISAIWNSYSKSDNARSPRITAWPDCFSTYSTSNPSKRSTLTLGRSVVDCSISVLRSAGENSGCLLPLRATATTTRSNKRAALWMTSKWPLVRGSKLPG